VPALYEEWVTAAFKRAHKASSLYNSAVDGVTLGKYRHALVSATEVHGAFPLKMRQFSQAQRGSRSQASLRFLVKGSGSRSAQASPLRQDRPPRDIAAPRGIDVDIFRAELRNSQHDSLGAGVPKAFLPFEEARLHVRAMNFTSRQEYKQWSTSGQRPDYIPSSPDKTYKGEGWLSWPDWLGYGEGRLHRNEFLPFAEARQHARALNFTSKQEYNIWSKNGQRPDYIPSSPYQTFKGKGWQSWPDWLGYERKRTGL